ncbi:PAS domain-containing protein [Methylocucumis oryzae]|uniref:Diguanylate cyclase n=1 Tax=Methylocucumis oryzae TaxID=1632867 RepID=A0A0F3IMJ0_9GAMM|nr:PAS domain-containing protein [Methylocucumis oryzae]KJV06779.1 diguanylate cyclase [Methylocucumis oryzae]
MLRDMEENYIIGDYREVTLNLFGGFRRKVFYSDLEIPYPEGKLVVSTTDKSGIITHANKAFVELSGYNVDELIGSPHSILRHPDMPSVAFKDLWDKVAQGRFWQGYVKNLRKDGAHYWVKATVIPNVRKGEVVGYTSVRRKPSRAKVNDAIALYKTLT